MFRIGIKGRPRGAREQCGIRRLSRPTDVCYHRAFILSFTSFYFPLSFYFFVLSFSFSTHSFHRPDGTFFKVSKEDYELHRPPIRGDIVTFSHDYQTRRFAPSNPVVYRIRSDMTWQDVIKSSKEPVRQFLNGAASFLSSALFFLFFYSFAFFVQNRIKICRTIPRNQRAIGASTRERTCEPSWRPLLRKWDLTLLLLTIGTPSLAKSSFSIGYAVLSLTSLIIVVLYVYAGGEDANKILQ